MSFFIFLFLHTRPTPPSHISEIIDDSLSSLVPPLTTIIYIISGVPYPSSAEIIPLELGS